MTGTLRWLIMLLIVVMLGSWLIPGDAHQDPCHRGHSCPSDRGTYTCGDLGYCSQCPDNEYCLESKPRTAAQKPATPTPSPPAQAQAAAVKRVIDGDTVELTTGEQVRLIGVDTPDTKHPRKPVQAFGKEATALTKKLVEGREVRLEFDVQRRDKYGRLLAYVYVGDVMLNAELERQGYAQVATFPPNVRDQDRFLALQREAREAGRGLWGR